MARILMTGLFPNEVRRMYGALCRRLAFMGHDVRLLIPGETHRDYPLDLKTFRIIPGDDWVAGVTKILNVWKPDLAISVPHDVIAQQTWTALKAAGVPQVGMLTPFLELKGHHSVQLLESQQQAQWIVGTQSGQKLLNNHGVAPDNRHLTNWPCFDWMRDWRYRPPTRFTILLVDQAVIGSYSLGNRLFRYMSTRPEMRLIIRLHSIEPRSDRDAWLREINSQKASSNCSLRNGETPMGDDLAEASVVVAIDSMSIWEALQVGLPVVSHRMGVLPRSLIGYDSRGQIFHSESRDSLFEILDRLAAHPVSTVNISAPESVAGTAPALDRICDVLRPFLVNGTNA